MQLAPDVLCMPWESPKATEEGGWGHSSNVECLVAG